MAKLKLALNMKKQSANAYSVTIVAGVSAWDFSKLTTLRNQTEIELDKTLPTEGEKPPVILTPDILANVERYRIAPKNVQLVTLWRANNGEQLLQSDLTAICFNLAKHTTARTVLLVDEIGAPLDDLSGYIERLRTDESTQKTAEIILQKNAQNEPLTPETLSDKPTQRELLAHFFAWCREPLKRDILTGQTYRYNGLHWELFNGERLERLVLAFFEDYDIDYTDRRISALVKLIVTKLDELPTATPDLTAYQNGALNKKTGEFLPLAPELNLRGVEPFELAISSDTPHFDKWLNFVTNDGKDEQKMRAILAGLYMVLTNRYEWQKFIEITGVGGSGKSVFGHIATKLNGTPNTAFIELSQMEKKAENRCVLVGKTLIYSPDQPFYSGDGDILKAITGGDIVTVKYLYKDPIEIKLNACYMMTTNTPLLFTDRNGGISRRRVVIGFDRQLPEKQRDPYFIEKIQGEIYGITNRLLNEFPNPETANEILESYRLNTQGQEIKRNGNHLIDFANAFEINPNHPHGLRWGSARTSESNFNRPNTLYKAYLFYCDCANISKPLPLATFKQAFADALKENGQTAEMKEIKLNGYPTLNVHFKHKEDTFKEWEG